MSRFKNALQGVASGFGLKAIMLLAPLIILPLFLEKMGERDFGLWMTILSFTAMGAFLDLGLGNGLLTILPHALARENYAEAKKNISSAYAALCSVALAIICFSSMAFIIIKDSFENISLGIIYASILGFAVNLPAVLILKIYISDQKAFQSNIVQAISAIATLIITYVLVKAGANNAVLVLFYALTPAVVFSYVTCKYFKTVGSKYAPSRRSIDRAVAKKVMSIGGKFLLLTFILSVSMNIDTALIARIYGIGEVAEFALVSRFGGILTSIVAFVSYPFWAAIGDAFARNEINWVRKYVPLASAYFTSIFIFMSVVLVYFADLIMFTWTGLRVKNVHLLMLSVCILPVLMVAITPYFMVLNSQNVIWYQIGIFSLYLPLSFLAKMSIPNNVPLYIMPIMGGVLYFIVVIPAVLVKARQLLKS